MLTIKSLGNYGEGASSRVDYMLGQAETRQADYYLKGSAEGVGEPAGRWHGRAAAQLGLSGKVMPFQLHGLMQGFDPRTYNPAHAENAGLVQRPGQGRRSGVDCTFVCPKSVSLAWALETPENRKRIEAAFHQAVNTALARLEREVITRRNHGGRDAEPVEGLFMAVFEHGTARVPKMADGEEPTADPHLHAHCLIGNVCLRKDGSYGSIVNDSLYDNQKLLGAVFRGTLCEQLRDQLGYHIEAGASDTFEIVGIGEHLRTAYSKRHTRIHEWIAGHRAELAAKGLTGRKAEDYAWARTRSSKDSVNRPALFREWQAEAARVWDFDASKLAAIKGTLAGLFNPPPKITVRGVLAELTAGESVFALKDIETRLWCARQHYDFDVKTMLSEIIDSDTVVLLRDGHGQLVLCPRELHDKEQEIARLTVGRQQDTRHHTDAARTTALMESFAATQRAKAATEGWTFNEKIWARQRAAIAHVTMQSGQIAVLSGAAGAGKSVSMACVRQIYAAHGFNVIGCALAGKAAENLQREAGIRSDTVLGLLTRVEHGHLKLSANDVIVADESGMIDSRLMHRLVTACARSGAKLITVGEAAQLQAVSAGGPFLLMQRLLAQNARVGEGVAVLDDITRQKDDYKWLTQAILDIRRGDAGTALAALAAHNCLMVEKTPEDAQAAMVRAWFADAVDYRNKLMIAGTRAETDELNALARELRRAGGQIGEKDCAIDVCAGAGLPMVSRDFAVGDRILFGRKEKTLGIEAQAVQNGYYGQILKIRANTLGRGAGLVVLLDDGRRVSFNTRDYAALTHAYSITVHKSQGATVDHCHVLASDRMTDREWGYVALSRSKGATILYATEDQREDLACRLSRSRLKGTSLDYAAVDKSDFRIDWRGFDLDALLETLPKGRFDRTVETLTQAITWGGTAMVETLLADPKQRVSVNVVDDQGNTPLHLACYKKNREAVAALLDAGATVDCGNRMGITPLMDAVRSGDSEIVALLVGKGADAFRAAKNGDTPFRLARDLECRAVETMGLADRRAGELRRVIETVTDGERLIELRQKLASAETLLHNAIREREVASGMVAVLGRGREVSLDPAARGRLNAKDREARAHPDGMAARRHDLTVAERQVPEVKDYSPMPLGRTTSKTGAKDTEPDR